MKRSTGTRLRRGCGTNRVATTVEEKKIKRISSTKACVTCWRCTTRACWIAGSDQRRRPGITRIIRPTATRTGNCCTIPCAFVVHGGVNARSNTASNAIVGEDADRFAGRDVLPARTMGGWHVCAAPITVGCSRTLL